MRGYGKLNATLTGELADFPAIDVEDCEREINSFFKAYVFYKTERTGRHYWTSCCFKKGYMGESRLRTDRELQFLQASHNERGACPFCGRVITYKCTGRLAKKKNLLEYQPVVILKAKNGDIYACAYWAMKDYYKLDMRPKVLATSAYHFHAGTDGMGFAVQYSHCYSGLNTVSVVGTYKTTDRHISEPLTDHGYVAYYVIGLSEISKSNFKYCLYKELEEKSGSYKFNMMRLLTVASLYPDKVEMLRKSGLDFIVDDLVQRGCKDSAFFNWEAKSYKTAFKVTKQELRSARELGIDSDTLSRYMKLRRAVPLEALAEIDKGLHYHKSEFYTMCRNNGERVKKDWKYIKKQSALIEDHAGRPSICNSYIYWRDCLQMGEKLGWDTNDDAVRHPSNIQAAHDRALEEMLAKEQREREEAEMKRLHKLRELEESRRDILEKRKRKYNISVDGYIIRVAESGEEILREGKILKHCVGGYAERHLQGATTILFLRRTAEPQVPLYTIEMNNNILVQIRGYRNDVGVEESPRDTMAWLLDPWLAWLKVGSKRDKNGEPKIKIIRKELKTA